jgi:hypothetical protein
MKNLPLARSTDIVVQTLGKEILIYDLITNKAFNLNETSSIVYQACNGKTTFAELSKRNNFTDDIIFLAIDELNKENLLENSEDYNSPFNGLSRREVIRKVGFASMVALPVIASLVAPTAAQAGSGGGTNPGNCDEGPCVPRMPCACPVAVTCQQGFVAVTANATVGDCVSVGDDGVFIRDANFDGNVCLVANACVAA